MPRRASRMCARPGRRARAAKRSDQRLKRVLVLRGPMLGATTGLSRAYTSTHSLLRSRWQRVPALDLHLDAELVTVSLVACPRNQLPARTCIEQGPLVRELLAARSWSPRDR